MADPTELLLASVGGVSVGALLVNAVKWLAGRNVNTLDKTLEHLEQSIKEQGNEMRGLISELTREIRGLRDTDIRQAEQIGALQKGMSDTEKRIDGQAAHYREQLDQHRRAILDELAKAVREVAESKGRKR